MILHTLVQKNSIFPNTSNPPDLKFCTIDLSSLINFASLGPPPTKGSLAWKRILDLNPN